MCMQDSITCTSKSTGNAILRDWFVGTNGWIRPGVEVVLLSPSGEKENEEKIVEK